MRPAAGLPPALRLAVMLGLGLTFVLGTVGGFVMSSGTSSLVGGVPPPGDLPLLGWSRHVG